MTPFEKREKVVAAIGRVNWRKICACEHTFGEHDTDGCANQDCECARFRAKVQPGEAQIHAIIVNMGVAERLSETYVADDALDVPDSTALPHASATDDLRLRMSEKTPAMYIEEEKPMAPKEPKQSKTGHRGIDTFKHFKRLTSGKGIYEIQCASSECKHVVSITAGGKPMAGVAASAKAQMRRHVTEKHRPCSRCGEYGHNVRGCKQPAAETAK